jgi:hypothetical protein
VITPLADGNFSVSCCYFSSEKEDQHGFWFEQKTLGYLTQEGVDHLIPHTHTHCNVTLELRISQ